MSKLLSWNECTNKSLVGNKAYGLQVLKKAGFLVPDFKVIAINQEIPSSEEIISFTDLISVRSGSPQSLPGLMVSFLNVTKQDVLSKITQVQDSWNNPLTTEIKAHLNIPSNLGTAVILQKMIPKDILIGSGVASSINPITKEPTPYISYQAQEYGDKVVISGSKEEVPYELTAALTEKIKQIDAIFGEPQEIEFCWTTEGIYFLQSRKLVTSSEKFQDSIDGTLIGQGIGSNQGTISGYATFENPGPRDILCVKNLNPSEIKSLINCRAIIARQGDHNSHLSVLCRLLNKPYIIQASIYNRISQGIKVSLDTDSGKIYHS